MTPFSSGTPIDPKQRAFALGQLLSDPVTYQLIVGGLHSAREGAIQNLLSCSDPADMHRMQGRVHALTELIEEHEACRQRR